MTPAERETAKRLERAAGILLACAEVMLTGRGDGHNCARLCPECRTAFGTLVALARAEIKGAR
jgi:hypothetical protein